MLVNNVNLSLISGVVDRCENSVCSAESITVPLARVGVSCVDNISVDGTVKQVSLVVV